MKGNLYRRSYTSPAEGKATGFIGLMVVPALGQLSLREGTTSTQTVSAGTFRQSDTDCGPSRRKRLNLRSFDVSTLAMIRSSAVLALFSFSTGGGSLRAPRGPPTIMNLFYVLNFGFRTTPLR